jgi:hypothetical protein
MKISELLDSIRKQDLVLPEFQREFVWTREQAKQLMVSLAKDYPVGGLLFWKTDEPPELKNIKEIPEKLGMIQVILDGQQRLTTLFMLIEGDIPPYYTTRDIKVDPRELYYNIEHGDFQYYQASRMRDNPTWVKVTECYRDKDINVFSIAKDQTDDEGGAFDLAQTYNTNLNSLRNVRNADLPVQIVPSKATLTETIDIFDRVNSQGTKLSDAELALTHITGKWAQARRVMKRKLEALEKRHFYFDLNFMTRALTGVVAKRGLFETVHEKSKQELMSGWDSLDKILDYLVNLLPESASIHSNWDLNTSNVFVPLIVYLSRKGGKFTNENSMKHAFHWMYAAHTWARYTSQTDQKLEHDISIIVRNESPWKDLIAAIIDQRGRLEIKPSDLEGRGAQHPTYRMMNILFKACGAVDWFNGTPIATPNTKTSWIQSHHIFPSSLLYKTHYDSENHLHKKIVNEIANRAFITGETNKEISNRPPEEYLPEVEKRFPGALSKQCVPIDPILWRLDHYAEFLEARRHMIAKKLNEFMESLITEPEIVHEYSINDLIKLGESATLEFKSTLQWNLIQKKPDKALRKSVLKTIAAFLNSDGGTLVIGVEDSGHVCGLQNDLKRMHNSTDRFANLLTTLITDYIGAEFAYNIKIRFEPLDDQLVCVVDVDPAPIPAFLRGDAGSEFYNRFGPTSRMLDAEDTHTYINMHWN